MKLVAADHLGSSLGGGKGKIKINWVWSTPLPLKKKKLTLSLCSVVETSKLIQNSGKLPMLTFTRVLGLINYFVLI